MSAPLARVLIVDDEPQIRRFLRTSLDAHGYEVVEAEDGQSAIKRMTVEKPDVLVLDLGLPDMEGLDVIKRVREWSDVPIIVLTARNREADKIEALDRGADDYLTKPFGMGELMARIRAALRHRVQAKGAAPVFKLGAIVVDLVKRLVTRDGEEVKLSPREYDLLRVLVQNAGRVVTHQQILKEVWGPAHLDDTQYLRVYVGQLRQKLEPDPEQPKYLMTEPGVGYRLREDEPA
ncbi:MAG TPA: response regulator [Alphaproteobacteria bacterium]|nr:response regulator [Alphaproteobacteria bacterium]